MLYNVIHLYDDCGEFGDAIPMEDVLFVTDNLAVAEDFVKKYSNPHVYDKPYKDLHCGELVVREAKSTPPTPNEMWWYHPWIS